jgi:hypothetical protein
MTTFDDNFHRALVAAAPAGAPGMPPEELARLRKRLFASSKDRYRATAAQRRLYGGAAITEFYIFRKEDRNDASKWLVVTGYGPTPGERKTFALNKAVAIFVEKGMLGPQQELFKP